MVRKYVLPLLALGMLCFAVFHVVRAQQVPPRLPPPVEPARSPFGRGVAGSGVIEAQSENIAVGSNLPGVVEEVVVKVGQAVKKGDLLFRLDDRSLQAELLTRRANLAVAKAQLIKLEQMPRPEELPALEARLHEAQANLTDQEDQLARTRRVYALRAAGEEDLVRREQALRGARAQVARAEADLRLLKAGAWRPDVRAAEAAVDQSRFGLYQTEMELERLEIRALVDGQVLQVNVRPGEFVGAQAGTALVVLGSIDRLHVRVDVDEHDIPRFRPGLPARAMLRGDPSQQFPLEFLRVEPFVIPKKSLTGDNTERVDTRVLQVIFAVKNTAAPLYVGQQVDVYVEGEPSQGVEKGG